MYDNCKKFNVGIYLRLSQEDEKHGQSESIGNQKDFITCYVIEQGWNIVDVYIDDGFSGLNFDRPDFKRMVSDIEAGRINLVITKDLSRLGRDYIDTGYYLERYFPQKNVRYIAINDGIDTFAQNGNNDMSPFKAVINDMYAKDISNKVRTALHTKKLKGEFIGSVAPYGYKKDPNNKGKLIIEEETASIVKRIFSMFIAGDTKLGIANKLSSYGVPTPSQSKNLKATQQRNKGVWSEVTITRILTNPTYIGNLTQNRGRKVNYKVDSRINLPYAEWIIVENTHEPIISKEDFDMARRIMAKKNYVYKDNKPAHLLTGIAKCGSCGGSMTFAKESPTRTYLVCYTWRKHAKLGLCTSHSMRESYAEQQIIETLRETATKHINKAKLLAGAQKDNSYVISAQREIAELDRQLEQIKDIISNLYKDKVKGIVSELDYMEMSKKFNSERENLVNQVNGLQTEIARHGEMNDNQTIIENALERFLSFENIDRQTLAILVNKIEICKDKKIKIHFNFHV